MDRLTKKEYLESLKEVFSETELSLLQEVYDKVKDSSMEKTDIISLCVEVILQEKKKNRYSIFSKKHQQNLKDKMKRNIEEESPNLKIDFIEDIQEEYYMDKYEDQSLERLLQLCKDNSAISKAEITIKKLNGIPTKEISEKMGVSSFKVESAYHDAIARLEMLYYNGLAGIMDDRLYQSYLQHSIKGIFKSSLDRKQVLLRYQQGHKLLKTEKAVYITINEMSHEQQQKSLRKI